MLINDDYYECEYAAELDRSIQTPGLIEKQIPKEKFVFDSGIRLNLVPDYFEM
jgi:hypothetical protein